MHQVFLGLGANLGEPRQQMRTAIQELQQQSGIVLKTISSLYQTTPWGGNPQPDYLNAVVGLQTLRSAREILDLGMYLEKQAGRVRTKKNAPRVLDIDLLLYNEESISEPDLQVPHPGLAYRAFMLVPLAEIAPKVQHPLLGKTIAELAARISREGVQCIFCGPTWANQSEE